MRPLRPLRGLTSFLVPLVTMVGIAEVIDGVIILTSPGSRAAVEY